MEEGAALIERIKIEPDEGVKIEALNEVNETENVYKC